MKTEFDCEKLGFKVCRVCIKPGKSPNTLSSLFDDDGEKAELFQLLTGVDVSSLFLSLFKIFQ